jgi:hypothetical protein
MRQIAEKNQAAVSTIGQYTVGTATTRGTIRAFSEKVKACGRFINEEKSSDLIAQNIFMDYVMLTTCALITNYRNERGQTDIARQVTTECDNYLEQLNAMRLTPIPKDTYYDHTTGRLWLVKYEQRQAGPGRTITTPMVGQNRRFVFVRTRESTVEGNRVIIKFQKSDEFWNTWRVPYETEVAGLFGTCRNASEEVTQKCLADAGLTATWSTFNGLRFLWGPPTDNWRYDLPELPGDYGLYYPFAYAFNGGSRQVPLYEDMGIIFVRHSAPPSGERFVW